MLTDDDIRAAFTAHRARVYRWAFGLCRRHDQAADVVQEVFYRMVQARPAHSSDRETIGWLRRVTQRLVIDRWRSAQIRHEHEQRSARWESVNRNDASADAFAVRAALLELSEQQRLVVIGKFYDDLTFEDIGAELGITTPTAKTHYLRAIRALRDRLTPVEVGGNLNEL